MSIDQFLEVIYANRELLGSPLEQLNPEDTHPAAVCKGCPLRVALVVHTGWGPQLYMWEDGKCIGLNPDPQEAAHYLNMEEVFTEALVYGWDDGKFFGDEEDFNTEFSGFLVGVSLRPAPLQLTSGD